MWQRDRPFVAFVLKGVAMGRYIIGIDQSTQGTKALLVDEGGHLIHRADRSHRQIVNEAGWVSHDPAEIATNVLAVARAVVEETGVDPADVAGIGISNQRETTVAWNRTTGEPLCDAVVWQCARARELCDELTAREGVAELVRDTTGLVLSPYYPAGKMAWILANVPAAAEARRQASCAWAPSMPGWSGRSRAARSFAATGPMPAARSSLTCAVAAGASRCARPLASTWPACRR